MKKIKTYLNHLEIITSVFTPDLEDFLDIPIQDIMNAWASVCIEALKMNAYVQMLDIIERTLLMAFSNQKQVYHIYFQLQNCGRTIEWLAKNFPELDIPRNYVFINDTRCKDIVSMLNVCMIQLETDSQTEILEIT